MGKRGPKPWTPSADEVDKIKLYAGLGSTQEQVARLIGKSVDTLAAQPVAKAAFEEGKAQTIAKVAGSLVQKALKGDMTAAIFYLKTQAGWKTTESRVHQFGLGRDVEPPLVPEDEVKPQKITIEFVNHRPKGLPGGPDDPDS